MSSDKDWDNLVWTIWARFELTQEQFASRLGVTFASVNRWESGRVTPLRMARMQIEDLLREFFGQGSRPGDGAPEGGR